MATDALGEFISRFRRGDLQVQTGQLNGDALETEMGILPTASSVETVTAEAFHQGVFGNEVTWDQALELVRGRLA